MGDKYAVTSCYYSAISGTNKRPVSGDAEFADGKFYSWMIHPQTGATLLFNSYRDSLGSYHSKNLNSPKRAAALTEVLEGMNPTVSLVSEREWYRLRAERREAEALVAATAEISPPAEDDLYPQLPDL